MAQAIPLIILAAGTVATQVLGKPSIPVTPGPDEDEARKLANKANVRIKRSREAFLQRQGTLGPIQLQAPTLKI